ncbi:Protein lifeguard 1 [Stylophora pistillata]|uniref:Protein lifeguard 1 n=1 Tax=Stylophora pistillata TaxID=50429 RepID=A0A2B4RQA0_STYPI|nr:Protein lifeguard 1 [Stylophora pistillata]
MTTNPSWNQPPYPSQPPMYNYGSSASYPPSSNQAAYPPPIETVPHNAAYPPVAPTAPPPSYESAVGGGKPENAPGNFSYQPQPFPTARAASYPTYPSTTTDVEYGRTDALAFSGIISFSDKSIRLGCPADALYEKTKIPESPKSKITVLEVLCRITGACMSQHSKYLYSTTFLVVFLVLYFVLICCEGVRRSYPANVIMLSIFTLSLSYLVGVISSFHETNIVLIMMGVTTLVCASVMIFACQTKYDFTTWGGVLFCAALAIFFLSIFTPLWLALSTTAGKIVIGGLLALVFVAFLAYDVQLVMGGKKYELSPEEYIFASLILYMDIIRIFLLLLAIFGRGSN